MTYRGNTNKHFEERGRDYGDHYSGRLDGRGVWFGHAGGSGQTYNSGGEPEHHGHAIHNTDCRDHQLVAIRRRIGLSVFSNGRHFDRASDHVSTGDKRYGGHGDGVMVSVLWL